MFHKRLSSTVPNGFGLTLSRRLEPSTTFLRSPELRSITDDVKFPARHAVNSYAAHVMILRNVVMASEGLACFIGMMWFVS